MALKGSDAGSTRPVEILRPRKTQLRDDTFRRFNCVASCFFAKLVKAQTTKGAGLLQPLCGIGLKCELVGQQAVDGEDKLATDVDLGVGNGRGGELHACTGSAHATDGAAEKQRPDIVRVVSIKDRRRVVVKSGITNDPDDAASCAVGRDHGEPPHGEKVFVEDANCGVAMTSLEIWNCMSG